MVSRRISVLSVTRVVLAKANVKGTSLSHACELTKNRKSESCGQCMDVTKTRNGERRTNTGNWKMKSGNKSSLKPEPYILHEKTVFCLFVLICLFVCFSRFSLLSSPKLFPLSRISNIPLCLFFFFFNFIE